MKLKFGRSTFRADPYEEDCHFNRLRYCFGDGGDGGDGGDDGSSGDDYGSDGFAGDTDASVGGGYASEGPGTDSALGEPAGYTGDWSNPDQAADNTADDYFDFDLEFNELDWMDDDEAMGWIDDASAFPTDGFDFSDMTNPTEVDATTAYAYSVVTGQAFQAPTDWAPDAYGVAAEQGMVDSIGQAIGLIDDNNYVIDPGRPAGDQVGQVTSDYSLVDAVVSAMVPGYSQDTMTATYSSGETQGYGEASFGLGFGIGVGTGLTATNNSDIGVSDEGTSQGGVGDSGGGDDSEDSVQSGDTYQKSYQESVAQATGRSNLLPQFLQQRTPNYVYYNQSSNPYAYYREGGKVQQMEELLANPLPVVDIAQVQKDPDSFLKNPESANSAEELEEIYKYNEYILDISRQPIQAQEGMQVGQPAPEGGDGPMGFVGQPPEVVPDGDTVADDVPLEVEEGTFVINAAAVEFAGSEDIKKMIMEALAEAEKQGLDISGDGNKIDKERQVSLLVSRGEVLIPPALAKIIGYDKLNKINNRGKEETEQRIAENGQAAEQPANPAEGMTAAGGGIQTNVVDTEVIDIYRSIVAQGGDPGRFQVFEKSFQEYQKGKVYRPMQSEIGTPEFDEEVRSKYGYAFPETKGGMLEESTYRRAPD